MNDLSTCQEWFDGVLACPDLSPTVRLVATVLGFSVHAGNGRPFRSYDEIAAGCSLSRRTAMRSVRALEAAGWLVVDRSNLTSGKANSFRLTLPAKAAKGGAK